MRSVILYMPGERLFPNWKEMKGDKQNLSLVAFGDMCEGHHVRLGGIDLGIVSGFRTTPTALGLIVEWADWIEQGQIIQGETKGR